MVGRIHFRVAVYLSVLSLIPQCLFARSQYTFEKLVQTGNTAPSPQVLGQILESSLDDRGDIVYGGDGGLFYSPAGGSLSLLGVFGDRAPGGGRFSFSWSSALSPSGELIFRGEVAGKSTSGIFLSSSGKITPLLPDGTLASNGAAVKAQFPVVNGAGDFAFTNTGTSSGLYLYSKGIVTPVAVQGQPAPGGGNFLNVSQYGINNSDQIAFIAFLSTGGMGAYVASGGSVTKILAAGDVFPDGSTFGFPNGISINDAGQVAFGGVNNQGSQPYEGLFLYSGGQYSIVLPSGTLLPDGSNLFYVMATSINNAGQIAIGCNTNGGVGTYVFSAGHLTQVAVTGQISPDGDIFSNSGEYGVKINNSGQVLLLSGMLNHFDALYLFSTGALTRVAGGGDSVNHAPQFRFPQPVNIASGDVVLFSDSTFPGAQGVFLASPGGANGNTSFVANATTSLPTGTISFIPASAMNSSGLVGIEAFTSRNYADLLLNSAGGLNLVAGGANASVSPNGVMSISNSGDVAFFGYGASGGGFYLSSNGQTSFLTVPPGFPAKLAVNSSDSLAFLVQGTFPDPTGIYTYSNGITTPLAVNGSPAPGGGNFSYPFAGNRFGPVMNDSGTIAFAAPLDVANQSGIYLFANGTLSRVIGTGDVAPDGSTFTSVDSPSVNASGDVAFWGITTSGLGIFVYSNGGITRVVASGDKIGALTVGFLDVPLLGDNGHVAFSTTLPEGGTAVFVARPVVLKK